MWCKHALLLNFAFKKASFFFQNFKLYRSLKMATHIQRMKLSLSIWRKLLFPPFANTLHSILHFRQSVYLQSKPRQIVDICNWLVTSNHRITEFECGIPSLFIDFDFEQKSWGRKERQPGSDKLVNDILHFYSFPASVLRFIQIFFLRHLVNVKFLQMALLRIHKLFRFKENPFCLFSSERIRIRW